MVTTPPSQDSFYQIYEFSQGDTPEAGSVSHGVRLSGGMTWEQVPPVVKEAKKYLEDQLVFREVRPNPCVFGQLLPDDKVWYALVAVAHLDYDRFGRPLTVFRYFWCKSEPEDWQCLQAILTWFAKIKEIPRWSLEDQLYLQPAEFYQVRKPVRALPNPRRICPTYLLPSGYGNKMHPWQVLQYLNRDVLATYWALKTKDPEGRYPAAWAWNVADLKDVHEFFIKPVDEVAYQKFKERVPLIIGLEPDPAPPLEGSEEPKALPASTVPLRPSTTAPSLSIKDALQVIADNFSSSLDDRFTQDKLRSAFQALDSGLRNIPPEQLQLPQDFKALGCDRTLWEKATGVMFANKFGLLFLWTLLLPLETIDGKPKIDHLLFLLTSTAQSQENQQRFRQFLRAIRKTFVEPLGNVDLSQTQNLTSITVSLLDLTGFFFGKLFVSDRQDHNSQQSKKLQTLFKNLLQEPSWLQFLDLALNYAIQNLPTDPAPQNTFKSDWQDFEYTLGRHIHRYLNNWNHHQQTYKEWDENGKNRKWTENYPNLRRTESSFFWIPLFKDSGILDELKNYQKQYLKEEEWWAQRWQALFDHLDWGYSTVKNWPQDQLLPGGIPFVPNPYATGLRGKVEQRLQTVRQNVVTQWGNGSKQLGSTPPQPMPLKPPSGGDPGKHSSGDSKGNQKQESSQDMTVAVAGIIFLGVVGAVAIFVVNVLNPKPKPDVDFAQSILQYINSAIGFKQDSQNINIQPQDLASALAKTLGESQPDLLIKANNGVLEVGFNPNLSVQKLEDYQQRMGIAEQNDQISQTADSLLCLTIDRFIRENPSSLVSLKDNKPITPDTLGNQISACNDERLFIDRQMYIANQRFWFGEILNWTQQSATEAGVDDAKGKLLDYLKQLDPQVDNNIDFQPTDPIKQRQLLKAFYAYAKTDNVNGALGISEGLVRRETQTKKVDTLNTSKAFRCAFSSEEKLDLLNCPTNAQNGTSGSATPSIAPTTPPAAPESASQETKLPADVQSFVIRYAAAWNLSEEEVLKRLKLRLGFGVDENIPTSAWKAKIRLFQQQQDIPVSGELQANGTTESNLATEIFGKVTPDTPDPE